MEKDGGKWMWMKRIEWSIRDLRFANVVYGDVENLKTREKEG